METSKHQNSMESGERLKLSIIRYLLNVTGFAKGVLHMQL